MTTTRRARTKTTTTTTAAAAAASAGRAFPGCPAGRNQPQETNEICTALLRPFPTFRFEIKKKTPKKKYTNQQQQPKNSRFCLTPPLSDRFENNAHFFISHSPHYVVSRSSILFGLFYWLLRNAHERKRKKVRASEFLVLFFSLSAAESLQKKKKKKKIPTPDGGH